MYYGYGSDGHQYGVGEVWVPVAKKK